MNPDGHQAVRRKPLPRPPLDGVSSQSQQQQHRQPPPPYSDTAVIGTKVSHVDLAESTRPLSMREGTELTATTVMPKLAADSLAPLLPRRPPAASALCQFSPGIAVSPSRPAAAMSAGVANKTDGKAKEPSIWKTALDETRFFAGGLMQKPYESTKHYTVMRHSSGLVMYHGPATCMVVTMFSTPDHAVPADRTVWLQQRGFSGNTGLKLKTLVGASGSWLDVTPERQAAATELPAADERGYQRDIAKLMKKTEGRQAEKALLHRRPRETLVVRIPAASVDGYFRLVICTGGGSSGSKRKVLCGSPVFRVASTSSDSSIFRGASLSTLPMEAGVKIASVIGNNYVVNTAAPIVSTVQDTIAKYQPGTVSTMAAQTAYDNSRIAAKVDEAGETYEDSRATAYRRYTPAEDGEDDEDGEDADDAPPEVVGPDSGPEVPFPLSFEGYVVPGTGRSTSELGVPTANLAGVSDDLRLRLRGVYFGWATVTAKKTATGADVRLPRDWVEVVVTVGPLPWRVPGQTASVVARNDVVVHLLYDVGSISLVDAKIHGILMGFLRPLQALQSPGPSARVPDAGAEAAVVVASLSRPRWGPQMTLAHMTTTKSGRSLADKYADTRGKVQKQVDRIPLHWAGVRTTGGELRDQLYGHGGFWVAR